jgi:hypothetical protein
MSINLSKALLGGVALAIAASFAVPAGAQTFCAWPTTQGVCLPPPPGGSMISYPAPFGPTLWNSPWESRAYVPGAFPGPDTVHLAK